MHHAYLQVVATFLPEVAFPYYQAKVKLMVPGMQDVLWTLQVCFQPPYVITLYDVLR